MEMAVQPVHGILDSHMEVIKRVALRDLEPPPDWWFGNKKCALELTDVFEGPSPGNAQFLKRNLQIDVYLSTIIILQNLNAKTTKTQEGSQ